MVGAELKRPPGRRARRDSPRRANYLGWGESLDTAEDDGRIPRIPIKVSLRCSTQPGRAEGGAIIATIRRKPAARRKVRKRCE